MLRAAPVPDVAVRRRTLAVVSGAALALAACDLDPRSGSGDPGAAEAPEDPDLVSLTETATAVAEAAALVAATIAAHPALGPRLGAFATLHAAHAQSLDSAAQAPEASASATSPATGQTGVPPSRPRALAAVRTAESALATDLAARALRAESGTFARLLAVMSAAVQQGLLSLDREAGA